MFRTPRGMPVRWVRCGLMGIYAIGLLGAQETARQYVGAETCGSCHAEQFKQQSSSFHARSLRRPLEHPLADSFLPKEPLSRPPNFQFRFSRDAGEFRVRVSDGATSLELPIEWAFGGGQQAVTFVSQLNEDVYVEYHFSYYASSSSLAATPGHHGGAPDNAEEAVGVHYKTFDPEPKIMRCFQCHSTGPLSLGAKLSLQPREPGVRCEVCHGPGRPHVEAVGRGETEAGRKLIHNPKRLSADELNRFCGNCHRMPPAAGEATNWENAWNVRHQPLYLSQSACFAKSQGALSCLSCHDPHQPLRVNDAPYYDSRCAECHQAETHPRLTAEEAGKLDNCSGCHMPKVAPLPNLQFSNHWIGVYLKGATLKPSR